MIDTPVKRYSSGMYVRLAFSVAAHLESEILIVDEVLAVGDAAFRRKCSDKMLEVAGQGRTLIFVSHDMDAINRICDRAVHMAHGKIISDSAVKAVVNNESHVTVADITRSYIRAGVELAHEKTWSDVSKAPVFDNCIRLNAIRLVNDQGILRKEFDVKQNVVIELDFNILEERYPINVHLHLKDLSGHYVLAAMDNLVVPADCKRPKGRYLQRCTITAPLLNVGDYRVDVEFYTGKGAEDRLLKTDLVGFAVTDDLEPAGVRGNWPNQWPNCITRPLLPWQVDYLGPAKCSAN
jgi:lipopolysaccharide transport system ATP-binding protein